MRLLDLYGGRHLRTTLALAGASAAAGAVTGLVVLGPHPAAATANTTQQPPARVSTHHRPHHPAPTLQFGSVSHPRRSPSPKPSKSATPAPQKAVKPAATTATQASSAPTSSPTSQPSSPPPSPAPSGQASTPAAGASAAPAG